METTEGVANFFIEKALAEPRNDLTQLKLQKLVYYAHGWHLGLTAGEPLFREPVQAWRYGPVIESLRDEFRSFGIQPINRKARDLRWTDGKFNEIELPLVNPGVIGPFLTRIWDEYGRYSGIQLSNMTHEAGTPWHQVASHYGMRIPPGITIPNDLIREHFQAKASKPALQSAR